MTWPSSESSPEPGFLGRQQSKSVGSATSV